MESEKQQAIDEAVELLKGNSSVNDIGEFPEDLKGDNEDLRGDDDLIPDSPRHFQQPEVVFETGDLTKKVGLICFTTMLCTLIGVFVMLKVLMAEEPANENAPGIKTVMSELVKVEPSISNLQMEVSLLKESMAKEEVVKPEDGVLKVKVLSIESQLKQIQNSLASLQGSLNEHRHNAAAQFKSIKVENKKLVDELGTMRTTLASVEAEPTVKEEKGYRYNFKTVKSN